MSRGLTAVLEKMFDDWRNLLSVSVASGVLVLIGAFYQADHTLAAWHGFGWFTLLGFAAAVASAVGGFTQLEADYLQWFVPVAIFLFVFGPEPDRFPGIHLHWWWLVLAAGSGVGCFFAAISGTQEQYEPFERRFREALVLVGVCLSVGIIAIYHTEEMTGLAVLLDAVLFVCWLVLNEIQHKRTAIPIRT